MTTPTMPSPCEQRLAILLRVERRMVILLRIWVGLFAIGGIVFAAAGNLLLASINYFSTVTLALPWPPLPLPAEKFWLALAGSLMATLAALCWQAQRNLRVNYPIVSFVLISKFISTLLFTLFFFTDGPTLAYLLGGLGCDGPIFVLTLALYVPLVKAYRSGPALPPKPPATS